MSSSGKDFGANRAGGQGPSAGTRTQSGTSTGEWLVNVAGDVVVPMTTGGVIENLRAGKLSESSLVWRIGMHDWSALFDVPQLRLAAGSPALPPASARVLHQQPLQAQAEARRRRDTLPFGFPVARDPASVGRPAGLSLISPSAPAPAATPANAAPEALAVYDRPAASLTFSEAALSDWSGAARPPDSSAAKSSSSPRSAPEQPSPARASAATLRRSNYPNSLAPTAADTGQTVEPRGLGQWGDRSVVFASEYRAAKATSKRRALWAALGSASIASVLTLWLVHWPALHVADARLIHPAQGPAEPAQVRPPRHLPSVCQSSHTSYPSRYLGLSGQRLKR